MFAALSASHVTIPDGFAGTRETLKLMRGMVRRAKHDMRVKGVALALVAHLPPKEYPSEAAEIHNFVRDQIRYVRDTTETENLVEPVTLLDMRQGDCASKAVLLASLLESIGHPTRFVAVGHDPDSFEHVFVETKIARAWIASETTEPVDFGWSPPNYEYRLIIFNTN
jgi:hypothetical protein